MLFSILLASVAVAGSSDRYLETLYPAWGQSFAIEEVVHQEKSEFWDLAIFENPLFGRVLAIDGVIQTTEADEAIYHEMMAHVPLLAHGHASSVLIIGGGDGGLVREVLRHKQVQRAVMVEIDRSVIDLSRKYLPRHSDGAFEDPRVELIIDDASKYVKNTDDLFDVILCDSTDPVGPAKVLFSTEFYGDCKKRLKPNGIFVNQNGVPFLQKEELKFSLKNRKPHFKNATVYLAPVPSYVGGFMAFGWSSDKNYRASLKILRERLGQVRGKMKYYTPEIHKASFALPQAVRDQTK